MRGGGVCWDMSSTCVQGAPVRSLGGYQPGLMLEPHSPAPAWQMHHPITMKQEPLDEDRNDSGINSGMSDFHSSSSPGSENSHDSNVLTPFSSSNLHPSSVISRTSSSGIYPGFRPVPTGQQSDALLKSPINFRRSPPIMSTPTVTTYEETNLQLPRQAERSPSCDSKESSNAQSSSESDDPLQKLQMSLEKAGMGMAPSMLSPKTTSEHSADDENRSDGEMDEYDEQGIRVPKVNSHGKIKTFKCKQCDFVAVTKLEFWEHSKAHIKADKLLTCPKCPFVTEYKHHLEYHLRNHFGSKPFKCDKCSYSCVNKSMLNSHMKSHSNIYQYRCADCSYATKYCHSLKLHLRKYSHKPAMVLNPDGSPNPLPIIDVYGTRRGPKQKNFQKQEEHETNNPAQILQNQFAQFVMNATSPQMPLPFPYPFFGTFPNPLLFKQNLEQLAQERENLDTENLSEMNNEETTSSVHQDEDGVLDLSKPENNNNPEPPTKNRRKGRAYKLEFHESFNEDHDDEEDDDEGALKIDEDAEKTYEPYSPKNNEEEKETVNNNKPGNFSCQYCNIAFGDIILYTMHMGYHGFKDPFICNMCGEECNDKVSFFLHIARNPHT